MQPITIKIKQRGTRHNKPKECNVQVFEHEGEMAIELNFKTGFPKMEGTVYEKIVIAIFNAVKEK